MGGMVNAEAAQLSRERVKWSFGQNWEKYLRKITPERLQEAKESLMAAFDGRDFRGKTFLDIGCGSGLFSLAAHELGATVTSIDVDPHSIRCAEILRGDRQGWKVLQRSVLTASDLPTSDLVYSWGVLHHTGDLKSALWAALRCVGDGGVACIALYNTPRLPRVQLALKRTYNRLPTILRPIMTANYALAWIAAHAALRHETPRSFIGNYARNSRGMSFWRDCEDWLGGLPCDFTEPEAFTTLLPEGFTVVRTVLRSRGANHEYLIERAGIGSRMANEP